MRFLLLLLSVFVLSVGSLAPLPAYAAEDELNFEDRQACFQKTGTFLSSFLSTDGAGDYWKDIFSRNRCQQDDIFALDEEVEALLIELYETDCTVSEFTELEDEIREKKMEMYYVRHLVDLEEDSSFENDINAVDWDLVQANLYADMVDRYVDGKKAWVDQDTFDTLYESWNERYESRLDSYLSCDASPWQEVSDKTHELIETMNEISETFKKNTQQMKEEFEETQKERREEAGLTNANGEHVSTGAMIKSFLKKSFQVQVSNLPNKETLADIQENFAAIGALPSTEQASQGTALAELEYEELSHRAELVAKYSFLYRDGNSTITSSLRLNITELIDIVKISTDGVNLEGSSGGSGNLKQLSAVAKEIWKKQGKTSVQP